jgi:hypothetical protein
VSGASSFQVVCCVLCFLILLDSASLLQFSIEPGSFLLAAFAAAVTLLTSLILVLVSLYPS